ncbi:MAG: tetratricopeptide repeat protein [Sphingobacteriales bacterium]
MKSRTYLILTILFLFPCFCRAEKKFDFNTNCLKAYKEIVKLKLSAGQEILNTEKKNNPDNLIPYFLENYIDFFVLFFNEDPAEYKSRISNLSERLDKMDEGPSTSPFFKYTKAIINFQWAAVKVKFGYRWDAGWEFRRSYLQVKVNKEKFPGFQPNNMLYGAMQTVVGTIPDGYKWLSNLLGMKGNINSGMSLLSGFLNSTDAWVPVFKEEAVFYYAYLRFHVLNEKEEVFQYINQQKLDVINNHLFAYMAANLAINNKQSSYARQIIQQRNPSTEYLPTSIWDLEMGYAKLNHLENDATIYLQHYLNTFKGKFYVKDALQKLSWCYLLQGNINEAEKWRKQILSKGNTDSDADKQALKEAKSGQWPSIILLKARLLNDGGYYKEALDMLVGKSAGDFTLPEEKVEFAYRLGRIYDDLGEEKNAIDAYLTTIKTGEKLKAYFAARAALQLGFIYEKKGQKNIAIAYYQRCLDMNDHDFKDSLDQKAKAGIARCKGE